MISSIPTALTGLAAASKRLEVASTNIANINSTRTVKDGVEVKEPYRAQEVAQVSQETGGVQAKVEPASTPEVKVFAPDNPDSDEHGFLHLPNVSLEEQVVQSKLATYDYKANLKTIQKQDELFQSLLNIIS